MSAIDLVIEMADREYEAGERRFLASCAGFEGNLLRSEKGLGPTASEKRAKLRAAMQAETS